MSQTVQRAISLIEQIAETPRTLGELSEHVGFHKSTVLRLLQTLEGSGFARRTSDGRWAIGARFIGIAHQALEAFDLRTAAGPHLRALADLCGHTVHLAQFADGEVTYIDKVEGRDRVRLYSRVGRPVAIHASAVGKVILAYLEPELREQVIDGLTLERFAETTITEPDQLRERLETIRAQGWGTDDGEFEDFVVCIAAPVHSSEGVVRAGVSVTAPRFVADLAQLEELVPDLLRIVAAISADAGWEGP